jgi:hypothetical protein
MMGPYQRRVYDSSGRVARMSDLMREDAAIRGETEMRAADASAQMAQNIGNTVAGVATNWARTEEERPRRELQAAQAEQATSELDSRRKTIEVLKLTRNPETGEIDLRQAAKEIGTYDPLKAQEFLQAAGEEDKAALLQNKQRVDALGQLAGSTLLALQYAPPPERPAMIQQAIDQAVSQGLVDPKDIPENPTEAWLQKSFRQVLSVADIAEQLAVKQPKTREVKVRNPDGSETIQIVEDTAGQTFTSAPEQRRHMVTTTGPDGRPMQRLATEEELADGVTAYREPRAPSAPEALVAIVGPDGKPVYVPRSEAVGKAPASTREQGRQVISGDVEKITDFDTSLDDLGVIRETLQGVPGGTGTAARIGAALPDVVTELTGVGAGPKSRQATIDRVKQVIGKALEGGVLRKEDEEKYKKILPTIQDPPDVVETKLTGLEQAIRLRRERHLENLSSAGYDTSRFSAGGTRPSSGTVTVQTPDGPIAFPDQKAADAFKRAAGIK